MLDDLNIITTLGMGWVELVNIISQILKENENLFARNIYSQTGQFNFDQISGLFVTITVTIFRIILFILERSTKKLAVDYYQLRYW